MEKTETPWGYYKNIYSCPDYLLKTLHINPGEGTSYQSHNHRAEIWQVLENGCTVLYEGREFILGKESLFYVPVKHKHSIFNNSGIQTVIREIQIPVGLEGKCVEDDIIRWQDPYSR